MVYLFIFFFADHGCNEHNSRKKRSVEDEIGTNGSLVFLCMLMNLWHVRIRKILNGTVNRLAKKYETKVTVFIDTVFISFRFAAKAELHEWGQY